MNFNRLIFNDLRAGRAHHYEWMNNVPLNGRKDTIRVNYFRCKIFSADKPEKVVYQNGWVTGLPITLQNIKTLAV